MNMKSKDPSSDPIWQSVLEGIAMNGVLSRFYQLPRHEMAAIMRLHGPQAIKDVAALFTLTHHKRFDERNEYINSFLEARAFAVLMVLGRSMKCWVESESQEPKLRARWKVAHA